MFLLMQRKTLCHIYPSKVPTFIHLIRGENLRWMSPRCLPDAFQMSPRCLPDAFQMSLRCLSDILYPNKRICLGSRAGVIFEPFYRFEPVDCYDRVFGE